MTFTATLCPVSVFRAWYTFANAPHPRSLPTSYFPNRVAFSAAASISGIISLLRPCSRESTTAIGVGGSAKRNREELVKVRGKETSFSKELVYELVLLNLTRVWCLR
ncbi:hypothetical protein CR513_36311, partial [Mucuna pruriens]